jgi:hypothetical protein
VRTCTECGHGIEDEFRFCPHCGAALRTKIVEYFRGVDDLGDGTLRVSVYLTQPQHVRLSIWKGEAAEAALSLSPGEADRFVAFLHRVKVTRRGRLEGDLRRSVRALAGSLAGAVSPPRR